MNQSIALAVVLVLIASVLFAVAAVVQHTAVGDAASPAEGEELSGRQLLAVIRNPRWLGGLLLTGVGAVIQVGALMLAPITVVQPLGVLAVPWTMLLAARIHKRSVSREGWLATGLTVAGTAAFAWVAITHAAPYPVLNESTLIIGTLAGLGVAAALALVGSRGPLAWKCLAWSSAAAVVYGAESGVVKAIGSYVVTRPWATSPTFWFLAASIAVGAVLAGIWIQQGYASGPAETVVGALNAAAPVAGVAYGIAVLGEGSAITPLAAALMLAFAAVALWGVVMLSRIHPARSGH